MEDPGVIYCHFKAPKRRISLELCHFFAERWFAETLPAAIGSLMWDMVFSCFFGSTWHVTKNGGGPLDRVMFFCFKGPCRTDRVRLNSLCACVSNQFDLASANLWPSQRNGLEVKVFGRSEKWFLRHSTSSFDRIAAAFCVFASRLLQPRPLGKKGRKPGWFLWVYPFANQA